MRLITKFSVFTLICLTFTLFSTTAWAKKKIGVLVFTQENHYNESLTGVMDQLEKEGFGKSKVDFTVRNAEGNKVKAVESAKEFASSDMDLVIVLGTSAAMIAANEIRNIPIVFSMVYDPVGTKIALDWKTSGNNVTGASNKMPMSKIFASLKKFAPVAKKLAVFYEPNEKNSVLQLKELLEGQKKSQISVLPVPITRKEDIMHFLPNIIGSVDALFIAGSSILGEMTPVIVDTATKAKLITLTHLKERVERGVLLGVCANSYAVGRLSGEKAVKVLKGANPATIPISTLKKFDVLLNVKTASAGQFQIPPAFMKTVSVRVE